MLALLVVFGCARGPTIQDVPDAVNDLASAASDAYSHAISADWSAVGQDAEKAERAWSTIREVAEEEGAPKVLLVAVDVAIDALTGTGIHTPSKTARIANTISSLAGSVYGLFKGAVPTGILGLTPGGREVTLDSMDGDAVAAAHHLAQLGEAWSTVRQDVVKLGGEQEAKKMDEWIGEQAGKLAKGDVASVAKDGTGSQVLEAIGDLVGVPWSATPAASPMGEGSRKERATRSPRRER
jgi:NAD(P)H-hydrate repair Nnr-like enzyme with NAD(P)H-hydrate epimerase domain